MKTLRRAIASAAFCASILLFSPTAHAQHGLIREVYANIFGGIPALIGDTEYPDNPVLRGGIENFESPGNFGDFYGQRVRGFIKAPMTGDYIFWIASDDDSQLYLSTTQRPEDVQLIAEVVGAVGNGQYDLQPNQKSAPIRLEQDKLYYIEALHVEGSGDDHLAVRWQLPDGTIEEPIPSARLFAELTAPQIRRQPASQTVVEGTIAVFSVELGTAGSAALQWYRNGGVLAGQTNSTLVLNGVVPFDSGSRYTVRVTNDFGTTTSQDAVLTVDPDTMQPLLVSAQNPGVNNLVSLTFSEPLDAASAQDTRNYQISGGGIVRSAVLDGTGMNVLLTLDAAQPLVFGQTYTVTVDNLRDRAVDANLIDEGSTATFVFGYAPLDADLIYGGREQRGPTSRRTALAITEIMYHPAEREDGRNIAFIELFNSGEVTENVSGYRLTGEIEYVFPPGTSIGRTNYLVIAANPIHLQGVYGLAGGVVGPYTGQLGDRGELQLLNEEGAVLLSIPYDSTGKWPAAADGAGPSLVLARPSYGEADPRAWEASFFSGGSPGRAEVAGSRPYKGLVINEFLAHTDDPQVDFVELFNYSSQAMNVGGLWLTDDADVNKFQIPANTVIPALGFLAFDQNQLGFSLSANGERLIIRNEQRTRVMDAVRFGAQANGVSMGRFPDGNPTIRALAGPTKGTANREARVPAVVINEIMYNPISGDQNEEYIELHNRSASAVNLKGWRLQEGVSYTFIGDFTLASGGHVVIAKDLEVLRAKQGAGLTDANSTGNFNGNLANGGERVVLERPEISIATEGNRQVTNVNYVVETEVEYQTGGRWPSWADGGGGSIELLDPEADNSAASNWADSDESGKGQWVTFERRGVMDHGATNFAATAQSRHLHLMLMDAGEALIDNVQVIPDGGTNVVRNPGLEQGLTDWTVGGTHEDSRVAPKAEGGNALHVRAVERGDTAANRIRARLAQSLTNGTVVTLRADVKWLRGSPEFLLRLHGNYLELAGTNFVPSNLGTPGRANSRSVANLAPVIAEVSHFPVVPLANQVVTVRAQVTDSEALGLITLNYRLEPGTNYVSVPMAYNGAGYYTATIPGQAALTRAGFYIQASDSTANQSRFPADAPLREGIILWGDGRVGGNYAHYRLWLSQTNLNRWALRERSSNKGIDTTFVYNSERVVYNAEALYSGSPFHWGNYNSPLGNRANYEVVFPDDDRLLGQQDFILNFGANLFQDTTGIREQLFFWMADQLDHPYNYRRQVHVFINGSNRGLRGGNQWVFEDAQQPNRDFIDQWYPLDADGELYKMEDWFEFNDNALGFTNLDADLLKVLTPNLATGQPEYKKERYRWMFRKRAVRGSEHDYSELFRLVDAVNTNDNARFVAEATALIDVDEWMTAVALRHAVGDWDAFGYERGKNMYAYKPVNGKWQLLHWDISFAYGSTPADAPDLFSTIESATQRMFETPVFRRAYLRALYQVANGPMISTVVNPVIDERWNALNRNEVDVTSAEQVKQWVVTRRATILSELGGVSAGFTISNNGGSNFSTNRNTLVLAGTAPVNIETIRVNGVAYPVTWTSVTGWETKVALRGGQQNVLMVEGLDSEGNLVATDTITVNVTTGGQSIAGRVVINEIQYHPAWPGAEFVELHNTSTTTSYDLSGMRVNGLDFVFGPGSVITPGGFLVLVADPVAFGEVYGFTVPIAGVFAGLLDNGGETLSLVRMEGETETVLSQVRYDDDAPWPASADGTGASLQLIDPMQDITRPGNWGSIGGIATPGAVNTVRGTVAAFPTLWVNEIAPAGPGRPWVEIYNSGAAPIGLSGYYLTDDSNLRKWGFPANLTINAGQRLLVHVDGVPGALLATNFRIDPSSGFVALVGTPNNLPTVIDYLRYASIPEGQSFGAFPEAQAVYRSKFYFPTPGGPNNNSAPPAQIFINEWMASNSSTIQDPDDNDFDDWIELYNAGPEPVDLGGYSLTDDATNPDEYVIPSGTIIPAGGYLFIWADNENSTNGQLHASFQLSANGETVTLYKPDGTVMDEVTFGEATRDVSRGRSPDGSAAFANFDAPTPGFSNSGTTPSGLRITSIARNGGQMVITWSSEAGANYVLESKDNLLAEWTALKNVASAGASTSATDALDQPHRFYRVRKQ